MISQDFVYKNCLLYSTNLNSEASLILRLVKKFLLALSVIFLGLALSPVDKGERKLFYHSLASVRESWVPTAVLKHEECYTPIINTAYKEFLTSEEARPFQSVAQAFDKNGKQRY